MLYNAIRDRLEALDELRRQRDKTPVMQGSLTNHGDDVLHYLRKRFMRELVRQRDEYEKRYGGVF